MDKLKVGLSCKLIIISAPAGFGKTTLLSDWIKQHKIPAAWFSIDKNDNDPESIINLLINDIINIKAISISKRKRGLQTKRTQ